MRSPGAARENRHLTNVLLGAWSILKGLGVTLQNALRPSVTRNYPAVRTHIFPRFRGRLVHKRDEDGRPKCTACLRCEKICPTTAIRDLTGDEKKGRERRVRTYLWAADRCLYCNLCVEDCPFDAIRLSQEYCTVGETREQTHFHLEDLLEPTKKEESP